MNHSGDEDHGPTLCLARNDVGGVAMCGCGVLTVTLQCLSLRFEPDAFHSLVELLAHAQTRLDRGVVRAAQQSTPVDEDSETVCARKPPVH